NLEAVIRQDDGVTYRIGPTVSTLASGNDTTLVGRARPFLAELVDRVRETAGLSVLAGNEVLYLDHVDTDSAVQVRDWTGERTPIHVVSSGLILLAHQSQSRIDEYAANALVPFTKNTITTRAQLDDRLERARKDGFAWTVDELEEGITSLAAPVTNRE